MRTYVPAHIYIQQGADHSLPYPGEGYGGWSPIEVPVNPDKTAILVMHAWKVPSHEECPGIHRGCEYLPRAQKIMDERFPDFLAAARRAGIRIIHVGSETESSLASHPRYQEVLKKYPSMPHPRIEIDPETQALRDLHWRTSACDEEHEADFWKSVELRDFYILPPEDEDVACTSEQLFGLCREYGIKHLIYTGFCVNWCLLYNACGIMDMNRYGLTCSVVGDLTTAVENKESCRTQEHLRYGLWAFATYNGFVFLSDDLKNTLFLCEKTE